MKTVLVFILLVLSCLLSRAQQFGAFPSSFRWKQLNTDTARIIFTPGAEAQAQEISALVHRLAADTPAALGGRLRKVDIVLHGRTTLANGYVSLAPFRSEFYLIPGGSVFDLGSLPWHQTLAIHEYRHVQQFNNFRRGLSQALYYLFGERGQALANGLAVPDWFWEGDAVYAETALTPQGRGRQPYFWSGFQSLWEGGKDYSWMKLRNNSLKDYVPNHYQLGYLLVNYGYATYGPDFWQKVTADAAAFRSLLYPFQKAVARHAGVSFQTFRQEALAYYRQQTAAAPAPVPQETKTVTAHYFPQYIAPDSLLYLKTAYDQLPAFYLRDQSGEHKLALRSISSEEWFGYRNGQVVYTAYATHPRYWLIDYSDIVLLDLFTRKERRLTARQRLFTPDLSPSGARVLAVRMNDSLTTELVLLRTEDGKEETRIRKKDVFFANPRFTTEEALVVGVRTPDARMSLQHYDLRSGQWTALTPPTFTAVGLPSVQGDTVYFTGQYRGADELYAVRLSDRRLFRLTSGGTGRYYAAPFGDTLTWSRFTAGGLSLQQQRIAALDWVPVAADALQEQSTPYPVAGVRANLLQTPVRPLPVQPYRQSTGLLRFHSWSPDYVDPEFSLTLYSDNILNTFSNQLYYRYNRNERSHTAGFNTAFGGLFPLLNAGGAYTFNRQVRLPGRTLTFNRLEGSLGYAVPLNLTRGKAYRSLRFGSDAVYNRTMPTGIWKDSFATTTNAYLRHYFGWSIQLPRARQHIFPRWSWGGNLQHRHLLNRSGHQFLGNLQASLPGGGNKSIVLQASAQLTDTGNVVFSNRFSGPRGYEEDYYSKMWKVSGNYHFPIAYPDRGIANIVYLQRIRGNVFYDHAYVYTKLGARSPLRSLGGEMFFDTRWWNALPLRLGLRYSYLMDQPFSGPDRHRFELALPIDLIPD